jgi:hypothetical protein
MEENMSDLEPMESSRDLSNRGFKGVSATVGGIALLILKGLAGAFGGVVGIALGVVTLGLGASSLKSGTRADKTGGVIAVLAGALMALTGIAHFPVHLPLITGLARFSSAIFGIGAVGLLGYGVWNIFKFVKGLRNRA